MTPSNPIALHAENLCKQYGTHTHALLNCSLQVFHGEWLCLLGSSGCGKSTLLHAIAGLTTLDQGSISLFNLPSHNVPPHQRDVGMVFQLQGYYEHLSIRQNLLTPLQNAKLSHPEKQDRLQQIASLLQLAPLLDRFPSQISGGQLQRLAIGRALIKRPQILLLDEPFNHLDTELRFDLQHSLRQLHHDWNLTTLHVTHDGREAMRLADRIAIMDHGSILQVDSPQAVYQHPSSQHAAELLTPSDLWWVDGTQIQENGRRFVELNHPRLKLPLSPANPAPSAQTQSDAHPSAAMSAPLKDTTTHHLTSKPQRIGIRRSAWRREVSLPRFESSHAYGLNARVLDVRWIGEAIELQIQVADQHLTIQLDDRQDSPIFAGQTLTLSLDESRIVILPP